MRVQWLIISGPTGIYPCEAFLASDETPTVEDEAHCTASAEVRITYASGIVAHHCYHHYITRTGDPDRAIEEMR